MRTAIAAAIFALAFPVVALADGERTPAPAGAKVFIIEPADGATVTSPVTVKFGAEGIEIIPAGTDKANSGHHHLLIDTPVPDLNSTIPKDEHHVHYGKGQTEATVELTPGKHTLQLLLGDKNHVPTDPPVESPVVTVTVQ
ncbi:hypothetical protein HYPDE_28638 [Hyphomicrobium denitrificans 1NES1]|uniref:DUF4399 domain-containing protein n=1 Tax=Hyphomicrobium denitrificans 1NES1 TaxID=670307 RepID=N0B5C5_9HYPH|nr:DUF4399 domain-containing protein [Hyphomicrobium denitrificans]AGK57407.1 hypothetical protein HYPDE_28638 [Hyphomicrobium denitrificans 1NES1]